QIIREEGPKSHFSKAGTPTMGGALILLCCLLPTVLWADVKNTFVLLTTAVTAGYGIIGYLDDRLKIMGKNTRGLPGKYKILGQLLIGGAAMIYLYYGENLPQGWLDIRLQLSFPFVAFSKFTVTLPAWAYVLFGLLVLVATSNCVNLTDGLDGLAIGPVM